MSIKGSLGRAWLSVLVLCISLASSLHTHTSTHTTQRPTHNTPYSRLYLRGLERIQTDYGVVQLPDLDFLTPVRDRDRDRHKERPASTSSSSSLNPPPDMSLFRREALAIVYLEQELRLDQAALTKIVLKYPWILYLKVDSNLRPTVEVLRSFGFKDRDVRSIVAQTPSVLAINHAWTLPEKLLSLQRMFHLNRAALVRTVVSQPYLLTSSIDRNLKVAAFLTNRVGLQEEQVRALLIRDPRIAMSSVSLLERCWSALTSLYGLPPPLARKLILRCPLLLSRNVVGDVKGRVEFLCLDLGFAPPPHGDIAHLAERFPQALFLDADTFLRPNALLLQKWLSDGADAHTFSSAETHIQAHSEEAGQGRLRSKTAAAKRDRQQQWLDQQQLRQEQLLKLLRVFPQLMGYNPTTTYLLYNPNTYLYHYITLLIHTFITI
ncbi:hypothetical protein B484DRAFT_442568 [Ochromonadaceae sp. CCMP2298]|nr:hypothetical protein B484DRAFT_442568 [Ochromonadaceae sp. CCMP2298]|mmetsp:Transcript_17272/g.38318  ORF Transcript_17272/g.38318 Transcript_17272/m.38318 type:complete len:435 (-) Transcript_17272:292-1596(-)